MASAVAAIATLALATAVLLTTVVMQLRGRWNRSALIVARILAVFAVLVVLTAQVPARGWLTNADSPAHDWFVDHRSDRWTAIADFVTNAGGPGWVVTITVVLAAFVAWRRRSPMPAIFLLGIVETAALASKFTKFAVDRARPPVEARLVEVADMSYPSGHATHIAAFVGALWVVFEIRKYSKARILALAVPAALAVAAVAISRLYLGVHWLTDVVAGVLIGTIVVLIGALAYSLVDGGEPLIQEIAPRRRAVA